LLAFPRARWLVPKQWRFANAFLGSSRLSETLEADPRVKLVVNGHIHMSGHVSSNSVEYHSIGGDYFAKQLLAFDGRHVLRTTVS
jgi:hypothetical protein